MDEFIKYEASPSCVRRALIYGRLWDTSLGDIDVTPTLVEENPQTSVERRKHVRYLMLSMMI